MIFKKIKVKNILPIYKGLKKYELELDFEKDGFFVFKGKNGSGKTTIMKLLTPFSEPKDFLIEDSINERTGKVEYKPAYKELFIEHDGRNYFIKHEYSKSATKKSFLTLITEDGEEIEELNPNGNGTSFEKLIDELFNIDKSVISSSIITTTESVNFLDLKSTERKKQISALIPDVSEYILTYNNVREKIKFLKNEVNVTLSNIAKYGDKDSVEEELSNIKTIIEKLKDKLSKEEEILNEQKASYYKKYGEYESLTTDVSLEELVSKIKDLSTGIRQIEELLDEKPISVLNEELQSKNKELELKKSEADAIRAEQDTLMNRYKELTSLSNELHRYEKERNKIGNLKEQLLVLENQLKEVNSLLIESSSLAENSLIKRGLSNVSQEIYSLDSYIRELMNVDTTFIEYIATTDGIDSLRNKIIEYESKTEQYKKDILKYQAQLDIFEKAEELSKTSACNISECKEQLKASSLKLYEELNEMKRYLDENNSDYQAQLKLFQFYNNSIVPNLDIFKRIEEKINIFLNGNFEFNYLYINNVQRAKELLLKINEEIEKENKQLVLNEKYASEKSKLELEIRDLETRIKKDEETLVNLEEHHSASRYKIEDINEQLNANGSDYEKLQSDYKKVQLSISALVKEQQEIESVKRKAGELENFKSILEGLINKKERIVLLINILEKENEMITEGTSRCNSIRTNLNEQIEFKFELENTLQNIDDASIRLNELYRDLEDLNTISETLHPARGIPNLISNEILLKISEECNYILDTYFNRSFSLRFENNEKELEVLITSAYSGVTTKYSNLSAGEKSIIKLVLSVTLMQIKLDKSIDTIFLDEIDSFLDSSNRNSFEMLLDALKEDKKIKQVFIISHNLSIKGYEYSFNKEEQNVTFKKV